MSNVDFTKIVKILRSGDKMTVARKNMNTNSEIIITEEDRKAAMELFHSLPIVNLDQAISEYKSELDQFLIKFNAKSYYELMSRADIGNEFPPEVSSKILDYYSFINRHQA